MLFKHCGNIQSHYFFLNGTANSVKSGLKVLWRNETKKKRNVFINLQTAIVKNRLKYFTYPPFSISETFCECKLSSRYTFLSQTYLNDFHREMGWERYRETFMIFCSKTLRKSEEAQLQFPSFKSSLSWKVLVISLKCLKPFKLQ